MRTYFKYFRYTWLKLDVLPLCAWLFFVAAPISSYHSYGGGYKLVFIPVMILALPVLIWMQGKVNRAEKNQTKQPSDQLTELWQICSKFVKDNKISCPETIYQSDHVILNAHEFIEQITDRVGYFKYSEEDE